MQCAEGGDVVARVVPGQGVAQGEQCGQQEPQGHGRPQVVEQRQQAPADQRAVAGSGGGGRRGSIHRHKDTGSYEVTGVVRAPPASTPAAKLPE